MARKITPDSGAGNARLTIGRSGPNSGRSQTPKVPNAKLNAVYRAMNKPKPVRPTTDSIIGSYKASESTNYALPLGLGVIGAAALIGSSAAKKNVNSFGKNKRSLSNAEVSRRANAAQKRVDQLNKNTKNAGPYAAYSAPAYGDTRYGAGSIRIEKDIVRPSMAKNKRIKK